MHLDTEQYEPPAWASGLKGMPSHRVRLARLPTPLHRWNYRDRATGKALWIKRDDLTGMVLSGNKVRKLEFLLADALARGCDTVITCGGLQSNHCRATAVAARQLGMACEIALRTNDTSADPGMSGNVLIDRVVGARLHLITPEQYRGRTAVMDEIADQFRSQGRKPYIVPEGGSNGLGAWGYIEAMREIIQQCREQGIACDDIIVACGSGGTAAGLAMAASLGDVPLRVHAVNVCDDAAYFYGRVNEIFEEWDAPVRAEDALDIIDGYVGDGYAISRDAELRQILDVARTTGIILDPVYSGKAFVGMLGALHATPDRFRGDNVLFIHTGGLFGLFDKAEQLRPLSDQSRPSSC